jgi:hypothetical protein
MTVAFKPRRPTKRVEANPFVPSRTPSNVIPFSRAPQRPIVIPDPYGPRPPVTTVEVRPTRVEVLPPPRQERPGWLKSLSALHRLSSVVTGLLVGTTLTFYGMTVYSESRWTREYPQLEHLRHQEQQLRTAKEVLKHTIVESAEDPEGGLAVPDPDDMIYIRPAPLRPAVSPEPAATLNPLWSPTSETNRPLAY